MKVGIKQKVLEALDRIIQANEQKYGKFTNCPICGNPTARIKLELDIAVIVCPCVNPDRIIAIDTLKLPYYFGDGAGNAPVYNSLGVGMIHDIGTENIDEFKDGDLTIRIKSK